MPRKRRDTDERKHWIWVTGPDYYLDEDGSDRQDLEPWWQEYASDPHYFDLDPEDVSGGWWTCHKDTKAGDLILLYRTSPRKDIAYLILARTDAYCISDEPKAKRMGWSYGCDYEPLWKFERPLTLQTMRDSHRLKDWGPLNSNFRRSVFSVTKDYWGILTKLLSSTNKGYKAFLGKTLDYVVSETIVLEQELEERLADDLSILDQFGFNLELYKDRRTGKTGRQFVCTGDGGRIDLLCRDRKTKAFVVVELKNVRANPNTYGQITSYMGWVKEHLSPHKPVRGLVISRGCDPRFSSSAKLVDGMVHQLDIQDLGFG